MRKIIVGAQVSMDGVMQAPGGPTEDPTKGFTFGGWVMPYFDQEFGEELDRLFNEKFDLLLGRKTYEIFAAYWPYDDEQARRRDNRLHHTRRARRRQKVVCRRLSTARVHADTIARDEQRPPDRALRAGW